MTLTHLANAVGDVAAASETLRRAINRLAEELELTDTIVADQSKDIAAGLKREKELRALLRGHGLADFDE